MFKFSLQSLLDHRQYIEDNLQKEVAQSLKVLSGERVRLKALERQRTDAQKKLREQQTEARSMALIPLYHSYLERNEMEISRQSKRVDKARADHDAKRQELLAARKQRETLEKLKERQFEAYLEKEKAKDQSLMDEVAVIGHVRRDRQKME